MGSMLRSTRLSATIEAALGGSVYRLDAIDLDSLVSDIPDLDVVIVDGPLPSTEGFVTRFESADPPFPELRWMSISLLALHSGIPLILHDIDLLDTTPPWAQAVVEAVISGASAVLVTSDESKRRLHDQFAGADITVVPHPLADLQPASSKPGRRGVYWLLDTELDGQGHGVTEKVVERCAAESGVDIVRVRRAPPHDDEAAAEEGLVSLPSLGFEDAVSLLTGSAAVPLATRDIAVAAWAVGTTFFPPIQPTNNDNGDDLLPDQLLMANLSRSLPPRNATASDDIRSTWDDIRSALETVSPRAQALDRFLASAPHTAAAAARELRGAHMDATARRIDEAALRKREKALQEQFVTERRERARIARQLERAQQAGGVARENLADQRRQLRRSGERQKSMSDTIRGLREEIKTQERQIDELETAVAGEAKAATAAGQRLATSIEQYERLRSRRLVRVALKWSDRWTRMPWRR